MPTPKKTHGGPRAHAGRPPRYDAPRVKISARRDLHGMLSKACAKAGCEMTAAVDFILGRVLNDRQLAAALKLLADGHATDAKNVMPVAH